MYESFYHLKENPFGMTPNPRFFYKANGHRGALAYLAYGVFGKRGFLALTGEVGLGKTTVIRAFVQTLQPCLEVAFVLNTKVGFEEMLYMFLHDFGCSVQGASKVEMLTILNDFLIESYAQNRNPVLIIDEAQNLSSEVLEELRMLSNLETDNQKLIQIVLVGQPELEILLGRNELRQLRQRIPRIHRMQNLNQEEVGRYIRYRLGIAGLSNGNLSFAPDAQEEIFRFTDGIPRLINLVCERALFHGYRRKTLVIDKNLVEQSIRDLQHPSSIEEQTGNTEKLS